MMPRTDRSIQERNVPSMRLDNDADLRPGSSRVKMLEQEITILKQVNHANIIHLQRVYDTTRMIYLVMELCDGGELKQLLQRKSFFSEEETRHIICSLANAVVYLHRKNIVHRDLKLENILVEKSVGDDNGRINIKVTDFGLSMQTNGVGIEHTMSDACGTLIYMAPEMMSGRGYSQWCDIWSIGIIMYMLLSGESPFVSKTKYELLEEIMNEGVKFTQDVWSTVSDAAKTLLTCLLKMDPAYRMSASQILETPWITGDTNMPLPSNVLEMMRNYVEESTRGKFRGESSLTLSEDGLDLVVENTECRSQSEAKSGSNSSSPPASEKSKESRGSHHQQKSRTSSETTQAGAKQQEPPDKQDAGTGQKAVSGRRKVFAKQQRPQDKQDMSAAQKAAPGPRKADDQKPTTSVNVGPAASKAPQYKAKK
ncbi:serine/threonine-protein kinase 33 isoform X2 [Nelusetta ayraudi]|uniref:serine/threonine-protein kinase 33 isoform X2 n=1 Tax=Nelusetta ayraudi TaxID=303726 RepID=UPI003F729D8B